LLQRAPYTGNFPASDFRHRAPCGNTRSAAAPFTSVAMALSALVTPPLPACQKIRETLLVLAVLAALEAAAIVTAGRRKNRRGRKDRSLNRVWIPASGAPYNQNLSAAAAKRQKC
ncbi:MAG: hypothetical protein LBR96_02630, partial [Treponema sp.]|nr:hypothetical protein [Treponema sp.]